MLRCLYHYCGGCPIGCSGYRRTCNRQAVGLIITQSITSNLEQVANLLCTQANLASYPQQIWTWMVAYLIWATEQRP